MNFEKLIFFNKARIFIIMKKTLFIVFVMFSLVSKVLSQTETEPNNYFIQANPVALNDTFSQRILTNADNDYFKITTPSDGIVMLNVFALPCGPGCCCTSGLGLEFRVYGADTTTLYAFTYNDVGGGRFGSKYYPVLLEKGDYYVKVNSFNHGESSTAFFRTSFNFTFCDSTECNNLFDSATVKPLNIPFNESLLGFNLSPAFKIHGKNYGQDVDIYRVSIPVTDTLTINILNLPCDFGCCCTSGIPVEVKIYAISDTVHHIDSTSNSIFGGGRAFQIIHPVKLNAGNYYIKISKTDSLYLSLACFQTNFKYARLLPIKLISFNVYSTGTKNLLNWRTAQETNASHFIIQRSYDGSYFDEISQLPATGNSSQGKQYEFTDKQFSVFGQSNTIYYRLKMVDQDGRFEYSNIVAVAATNKKRLTVCPNPVKDNLFIKLENDEKEKVTLMLTDIQGRIFMQQAVAINNGATSVSINTSSLNRGTYILTLKGTKIQNKIIVKE